MSVAVELREQGRGMAGALLVLGVSFAYTSETWWLAMKVPAVHLLAFVVVGLAVVIPITRHVGFREDDDGDRSPVTVELSEVVFHGRNPTDRDWGPVTSCYERLLSPQTASRDMVTSARKIVR